MCVAWLSMHMGPDELMLAAGRGIVPAFGGPLHAGPCLGCQCRMRRQCNSRRANKGHKSAHHNVQPSC